jgi:hypothetical protein
MLCWRRWREGWFWICGGFVVVLFGCYCYTAAFSNLFSFFETRLSLSPPTKTKTQAQSGRGATSDEEKEKQCFDFSF